MIVVGRSLRVSEEAYESIGRKPYEDMIREQFRAAHGSDPTTFAWYYEDVHGLEIDGETVMIPASWMLVAEAMTGEVHP